MVTMTVGISILLCIVVAVSGNYYQPGQQYPGYYYNQDQQQQQRVYAPVYYYSPSRTSHVSRRSEQSPSWDNDVDGRQQTMFQKPRRTHYGQTGNTLTKFFDSVGESPTSPPQWAGRRFPSDVSNRGGGGTRYGSGSVQRDKNNRVQMGVANSMCDDAKTNLTMDWDMSPVNHTCYHPEIRFPLDQTLPPVLHCDRLPPRYVPGHVCMDEKIHYSEVIPTHGDHRPLWPRFGEYIFVPRERWLHNIEHGAVVMLYHPCAHPAEVNKLKNIVKGCVGKHIITPSNLLPPERPLALVAWACRLQMATVDEGAAIQFIKRRALRGPEGTYTKEGQYTFGLLQMANMTGNGALYGYSRVECVNSIN